MIKQEELEILKRISDKDIKKYRPELFSNNEKEKNYKERKLSNEKKDDSKDRASFSFVLLVFTIEIALLLGVLFFNSELITTGRMIHYLLFICGLMCALWGYLPNGKLKIKSQLFVFAIIPLCEFVFVQLLGISNWWGVLFIFVYIVLLAYIFDMDFDDDPPSGSNNSGKFKEALLMGLISGLMKRR